jgi:hypothetical protein
MLKIISYIPDTDVADPVTIAAAGAFFANFGKPQDTCPGKNIMKGADGTEKAEKSLLDKSACQKKTGYSHTQPA